MPRSNFARSDSKGTCNFRDQIKHIKYLYHFAFTINNKWESLYPYLYENFMLLMFWISGIIIDLALICNALMMLLTIFSYAYWTFVNHLSEVISYILTNLKMYVLFLIVNLKICFIWTSFNIYMFQIFYTHLLIFKNLTNLLIHLHMTQNSPWQGTDK